MKRKLSFFGFFAAICCMAAAIDLNNPDQYAGQAKPAYITKDNTPAANPITDKGAMLGRVLFYDKQLSVNNTTACGSCHRQEFAFGDTALLSKGLSGANTGRHAMRLVNARFGTEKKFFWDERATSLEDQTTRPVQDHKEMGYSGTNGDPDIDSLIRKMNAIAYYKPLFAYVYGDSLITEQRMQRAMAQFIRSIQSFDSKFDVGRAQAPNNGAPFTNFTQQENEGKQLFLAPPPQGGGCQGCHRAPEFDIDPQSLNNGIIGIAGATTGTDLTNTRAPSLRDVFNPSGILNTPLMHTGEFTDMIDVINHYNQITISPANTNLDPRLAGGPGGQGQNLNFTQQQKEALVSFLKTLSGHNIYTDPKWSSPFDANGILDITNLPTTVQTLQGMDIDIYPNPAADYIQINLAPGKYRVRISNNLRQLVSSTSIEGSTRLDIASYSSGLLVVEVTDTDRGLKMVRKIVKQ